MSGVSQQRPQQHGATVHDPHRWRLVLTEDELATLRDALAAASTADGAGAASVGGALRRGEALRIAVDQALARIDAEDGGA